MKKWISILLSLAMTLSLMPATVLAEEDTNTLPDNYVDVSNEEMYQTIAKSNDVALYSSGEHAGKKVDIAFVIDTTSSMNGAISNVKNSVAEFAMYLEEQGVDLRMSVVEYRDITTDGENSTVVHTINHSPWHTTSDQLAETLSNLSVLGGGDGPETVIDGLGCLVNEGGSEETTMRWSSAAYKFAFVLTDADYKINNQWGYENMSQLITALNAKAISTSVITKTSCYSAYSDLVEQTGGEFADIYSSDFVSAMKSLADNAMSNTVKPESVNVTVKAISKDTNEEVTVEGATVSVFIDDEVRYYDTDSNGVATIPLNDLTDEQIARATVSAHKAWSVGPDDPLGDNPNYRWELQRLMENDNGNPERYIYELHSEYIDDTGIWRGENLSDISNSGRTTLIIDEPRLLVNMSVCYYADTPDTQEIYYYNTVKEMLKNYSSIVAESTDGHIMLNKIYVLRTDNRANFYFRDEWSALESSMADIRIETKVNDNWYINDEGVCVIALDSPGTAILANSQVGGFFSSDVIDADFSDRFNDLFACDREEISRRKSFSRIQMGYEQLENNRFTPEDDGKNGDYSYSKTLTHETGHYLMGLWDEYLNADGNGWDAANRPAGAGGDDKNFGLMEYQWSDIELSKEYEYQYLNGDYNTKSINTMQSYNSKKPCENTLAQFLEDDIDGKGNNSYVAEYTLSKEHKYAKYDYARLNDDKFINLGQLEHWSRASVMSAADEVYASRKTTNARLADLSVAGANLTISQLVGGDITVYERRNGASEPTKLTLTENGSNKSIDLDLAEGDLTEITVVVNKDGEYLSNQFLIERSYNSTNGYYYESVDGTVIAYAIPESATAVNFMTVGQSFANGEYSSVNNALKIMPDDAAVNCRGELYSVASVNSDIDYTTISWFKYDGTNWTKLDTDLSTEENMNIGARCDYAGDGTYVLMAKLASDEQLKPVTDITYTNPTDRDGIVNLSFTDDNTNTAYYNIYYSDTDFESEDDDNVAMRKVYAGSDYYSIDLDERNKDGYAAIVAVAENGAKSPLSEVVKVNTGEADRDGDGIPDWYCDKYLLWPPSGEEKDIANSDDDNDGLTNLEEYKGGSDPTDPNDPVKTSNVAVASVELDKETIRVNVGRTATVTAEIKPADASNQKVQWYTDNEAIATVSGDGLECTIEGIAEGTTRVTAVTEDGGYTASAGVTVSRSSGGSGGGMTTLSGVKADVDSGKTERGTQVSLSHSDSGVTIYYTTDGSTPTASSTRYTSPITVNEDMTIKAIAVKSGYRNSSVATFKYTVDDTPVFILKENAADISYMPAYDDNTFKPDLAATRYEILDALNNLFDFENITDVLSFPDVNAAKEELVNKFVCTDVIDGYEDGTFRGDNGITRAELVKILSIMFEIEDNGYGDASYSDISGHWARSYINTYAKSGYVDGYPDGTFKPDNQVTRAEFVRIVNNILDVNNNADVAYNVIPDMDSSHWAYNDIAHAVK